MKDYASNTALRPVSSPHPVRRPAARLATVDAVRALALFGVLVMNLHSMSGLEFLSATALAVLQAPLDRAVDVALQVLVDKKALSAFSFLFGLSFSLLMESVKRRGGSFIGLYARRLVVLAAFGAVNFMFLYWGDILVTYAVLGALLLPASWLPQRVVLGLSGGLLLGVPAALAAAGLVQGPDVQTAADLRALAVFGDTSFAATVVHNVYRYAFLTGSHSAVADWDFVNIFGLFLLGLWTGRRRLPHALAEHRRLLWRVAAVALPVGVAASLGGVLLSPTSPLHTLMLLGRPVLALGYVALAALFLDSSVGRPLRDMLTPAGRLALTNYLAYGLIGACLFYGWGLGLIGRVGTLDVLILAVVVYILLLAASHAWLAMFRIGPVEWVWRSLTYQAPQPLRRRRDAVG